jgi:hypothetical protein
VLHKALTKDVRDEIVNAISVNLITEQENAHLYLRQPSAVLLKDQKTKDRSYKIYPFINTAYVTNFKYDNNIARFLQPGFSDEQGHY